MPNRNVITLVSLYIPRTSIGNGLLGTKLSLPGNMLLGVAEEPLRPRTILVTSALQSINVKTFTVVGTIGIGTGYKICLTSVTLYSRVTRSIISTSALYSSTKKLDVYYLQVETEYFDPSFSCIDILSLQIEVYNTKRTLNIIDLQAEVFSVYSNIMAIMLQAELEIFANRILYSHELQVEVEYNIDPARLVNVNMLSVEVEYGDPVYRQIQSVNVQAEVELYVHYVGWYGLQAEIAMTAINTVPTVFNQATFVLPGYSSSYSANVTTGTQTTRLLVVGVSLYSEPMGTRQVNSITYNGAALTRAGFTNQVTKERVEIWYLIMPDSGTHTLAVVLSETVRGTVVGAVNIYDLDSQPIHSYTGAIGESYIPTLTISSSPTMLILDTVGMVDHVVAGTGQTERWHGNESYGHGAGSTKIGASSVTMYWSSSYQNWALGVLAIKGAVVSVGPTLVNVNVPVCNIACNVRGISNVYANVNISRNNIAVIMWPPVITHTVIPYRNEIKIAINGDINMPQPHTLQHMPRPTIGFNVAGKPIKQGSNNIQIAYLILDYDKMEQLTAFYNPTNSFVSLTYHDPNTNAIVTRYAFMHEPIVGGRTSLYYTNVTIMFTRIH